MAPKKPAWVAEARLLIESGEVATQKEIAERFGKSASTVSHHFKGFGRRSTFHHWVDQARTLLEDGASYREVSRTIDIDHSHMSKVLPGYGWTKSEGMSFNRWLGSREDLSRLTKDIWQDD